MSETAEVCNTEQPKAASTYVADKITVGFLNDEVLCIVGHVNDGNFDTVIPLPGDLAKQLGAELINPSVIASA